MVHNSLYSLGRRHWLGNCPLFKVVCVLAVISLLITTAYIILLTTSDRKSERRRSPSKAQCSVPLPPPPAHLPAAFANLTCAPKYHLGFLKTHRCGSSSVQNILFRFAAHHELLSLVPVAGVYIGDSTAFDAGDVCDAPGRRLGFHILSLATRWNHDQVRRVLPNDTTFFTIVRDPVDQFVSMFYHLETDRFISIEQFAAQQPIPDERLGDMFGRNQQLWDLGLPAEQMADKRRVRQKVAEIEREFDLVMIAERMDESLVLLRHLLCWPTAYVVTLHLNSLVSPVRLSASSPTRTRLRQWLDGDYTLYKHFYDKFDERVQRFGPERMKEEVRKLREETMAVVNTCEIARSPAWSVPETNRWVGDRVYGFTAQNDSQECQMYVMGEDNWVRLIRDGKELLVTNTSKVDS